MYLVNVRPFYDKNKMKLEFVNELTIVICFYIILLFLDPSIESQGREFLGWSIIVIAISSAVFNMATVSK